MTNNGGITSTPSIAPIACQDPDESINSTSTSGRNSRNGSASSTSGQHQQPQQQPPAQSQPSQPPASQSQNDSKTQPHSWSGLKVNQTAFIHKLYSMLEDSSIVHLISWTATNDSFVITPGEEFSKVLSQYFKHTNVSSFVRQLNMYGFHKVNDTFHGANGGSSGLSENIQWEFRHGGGAFKRGDVESLRAIKRRASRQSTTSVRDGLNVKSISLSVPSTPPPNGHHKPTQLPTNGGLSSGVEISSLPMPSSHSHHTPGGSPGNGPSNAGASTHISTLHSPATVHHYNNSSSEWEYRIATLEQTVWYLQDSNYRLHARNNGLSDVLKKANHSLSSTVDSISKLSHSVNSNTTESSGPQTTSPRSKVEGDSDLDRIRQGLHTISLLLTQLDDPAYGIQQPPSTSLPASSQSSYSQGPPPPPPIQTRQPPQPAFQHNIYSQFKESSRERAQSVIYDPLAPAPPPPPPASTQSHLSHESTGPPATESNSHFYSHPHQRSVPHVYQQGGGYFNYGESGAGFMPPSREQRPGSFPLSTSASYPRMNSLPTTTSNPMTPNGPMSPNPSSSQYGSSASTPQAPTPTASNIKQQQQQQQQQAPQSQQPLRPGAPISNTAFRRHTSGEVYNSSTEYQPTAGSNLPLAYMRQGSNSSIGTGKSSVGSVSSISSVGSTASNAYFHKPGATSPPLKHRGSSGSIPTINAIPPPILRQNSSSVQSLLNPASSEDPTDDRQVKRQRAEVL